jgi:hypothetical protein
MLKEWEDQDPILRFERYLTENKLWSGKDKKGIVARIDRELEEELKAAETLPPPERAAEGVYCNGCHEIKPRWKRDPEEVKPPQEVAAAWFSSRQPALLPNAQPQKKKVKRVKKKPVAARPASSRRKKKKQKKQRGQRK